MRLILTCLAVAWLTASASAAEAWEMPPPAYAYKAIARCADPATAKLQPNEAHYEICADQMALFAAALAKARADNRLLIVDFGATWCPWCRALQSQWPTPALLGHRSRAIDFTATFQVVEIGLSTIQAGRRVDIPSGHAVLGQVLARAQGAKLRSVPFIAVIDPADPAKTIARNLDDFELPGAGRHDPSFIRAFLSQAHDHLRRGGAAPTEPGWVATKINRLWMRLFGE